MTKTKTVEERLKKGGCLMGKTLLSKRGRLSAEKLTLFRISYSLSPEIGGKNTGGGHV